VAEAGVSGFNVTSFYAFVAPAATPKPIVQRLSRTITELASTGEVRQRLLSAGLDPAVIGSEELGNVLSRERKLWADVVRTARISPQ
jgi:tripartite-type tricarboxylate transporter receptor subunit TctC